MGQIPEEPRRVVRLWDAEWRLTWSQLDYGDDASIDRALEQFPDACNVTVDVGRGRWAGRIERDDAGIHVVGPSFMSIDGQTPDTARDAVVWDRHRRRITVDFNALYAAAIDDFLATGWPGTAGLLE